MTAKPLIYTIGHSTRSFEDLLELLEENNVKQIVDVRRFPGSRAHPQFQQDPFRRALQAAGLSYIHLGALGGRRSLDRSSETNAAWNEPAFRGYADYALSVDFASALDDLCEGAKKVPSAIMCAEAVPWRCHRRIIADYLMLTRGFEVRDIIGRGKADQHRPPPFAQVAGKTVVYPGPASSDNRKAAD